MSGPVGKNTAEGYFLRFFSLFKRIFCFSGWVAFRLLAFAVSTWIFVAFVAFHFALHPLHSQFVSACLFASSALPVSLRQVAFWLCGFWRLSGSGFSHSALPVGFWPWLPAGGGCCPPPPALLLFRFFALN